MNYQTSKGSLDQSTIPVFDYYFNAWGHSLSTYAKVSEKLTFLTPQYAHVRVRIRGLEMFVFRNILRTYLMDDPLCGNVNKTFFKLQPP